MIGKQTKGQSFRGLLNYLHHKEQAQLIGGNMAGQTPRSLAAEFRVARDLNPRVRKAVYHASLSLPPTEQLERERWCALAQDYVREMGFAGSQYVVYRHHDQDHDHIHIVASRLRLTDGTTVSDSWDYRRSEAVIRRLEKAYDLTPTPPSRTRESKAATTGERRRAKRTGQPNVRAPLRQQVEQATQGRPTMPQFLHRLQANGVNARITTTRTGKIRGISYELNGVAFSGTKLGKAYTFPGLQKHRGVTYQPEMQAAVQAVSQSPPASPEKQTQTHRRTQALASFLTDMLDHYKAATVTGQRYRVQRDEQSVVLTRRQSGEPLLQATWDGETESWRPTAPLQLTEGDRAYLKTFATQFYQQQPAQSRQLVCDPELEL